MHTCLSSFLCCIIPADKSSTMFATQLEERSVHVLSNTMLQNCREYVLQVTQPSESLKVIGKKSQTQEYKVRLEVVPILKPQSPHLSPTSRSLPHSLFFWLFSNSFRDNALVRPYLISSYAISNDFACRVSNQVRNKASGMGVEMHVENV